MAHQVAMIGDETSLVAFKPLGVATYQVERPSAAKHVWPQILASDYAVVFVTEPVYEVLEREIAEVAHLAHPAVTIIPSTTSFRNIGGAKIEKAIEKALGTKMPMPEDTTQPSE